MRILVAWGATLILALGLATPVEAQPRRRPPPGADVDDPAANRGNKRDRVKQRIRVMRAMVLTDQLGLDEATAGKLFPILHRYDDALAKLLADRAALRDKLAVARKGGKPGEINAALDQLVANQRTRWQTEEQRFADLRVVLTPEQAAELLDLLPEVDREILRGLRGAGAGRPGRRAPPPLPDRDPFGDRN